MDLFERNVTREADTIWRKHGGSLDLLALELRPMR